MLRGLLITSLISLASTGAWAQEASSSPESSSVSPSQAESEKRGVSLKTEKIKESESTKPDSALEKKEESDKETSKNDEANTRPPEQEVFFSVMENEVKVQEPRLNYDLKSTAGEELNLGTKKFSDASMTATLSNEALEIKWDPDLLKGGHLTVFDNFGKSIWEKSIEGQGQWKHKDLQDKEAPKLPLGQKIRFCLIDGDKKAFASICSRWYQADSENGQNKLTPLKGELLPRIILNNEESKLDGIKNLKVDEQVHFFAALKSEATFEFLSKPVDVKILDLVEAENKDAVNVTGLQPGPLGLEKKEYSERQYGKVVTALGFEDTILPNKKIWKSELAKNTKLLYFPGTSGGVFEYPIEFKNSPRPEDRLYRQPSLQVGTYLEADQIEVWNGKDEKSIWTLAAPNLGKYNPNYIEIKGKDEFLHKGYADVYRGYNQELAVRFTTAVSEIDSFIFFGEIHAAWWFNDLFGWQNPYFSKQRWGVTLKSFNAVSKLSASLDDGTTEEAEFSALTLDLRYRFQPGLWMRDESFGAILSRESGTFGRYDVDKYGVGFFWARSMPRVIDQYFNKISFLRYPKWVDMEIVKFIASPSSNTTLRNDMALNFHGKVLWTDRFYGEAGFGYKGYSFYMSDLDESFEVHTFYGTIGVGYNF